MQESDVVKSVEIWLSSLYPNRTIGRTGDVDLMVYKVVNGNVQRYAQVECKGEWGEYHKGLGQSLTYYVENGSIPTYFAVPFDYPGLGRFRHVLKTLDLPIGLIVVEKDHNITVLRPFKDEREKIKELIRKYDEYFPIVSRNAHYFSEQDTATKFIKPMIEAFGWNVQDPDEVKEQVPFEGGWIDCVLCSGGQPRLVVEYKYLGLSALAYKDEYRKRNERAKRYGAGSFIYTSFAEMIIQDFREGTHHYFEKPTDYLGRLDILRKYLSK